jgi:uncharacterized protein YjeT (DUF2065 family)
MDLSKILSITGLALSLIGTVIVFIYSPKVNSVLLIHTDEETNRRAKKDKRKNKLGRLGLLLIVIGVILQFVTVAELI